MRVYDIVFYCYFSASRCIYFYSELKYETLANFSSNNSFFSLKLFTYLNKVTTTQFTQYFIH